MSEVPTSLREAAEQLNKGETPPSVSVRTFLSWFGAERRGWNIVWEIRRALKNAGVRTEPDFNIIHLDGAIHFRLDDEGASSSGAEAQVPTAAAVPDADARLAAEALEAQATVGGIVVEPTFRVGRLASANQKPLSVPPDCPIQEVVTLLLANDFSQMPVMQGDREVKGMISWSSIGARMALERTVATARDCMESAREVSADESLFTAIRTIIPYQYVLIRGTDKTITGIVTATDLSVQFQQLTEPFLLLGEVENHIRRLIVGKFTPGELNAARDPSDSERIVDSVADLTFGEYVRLLENPTLWAKLGLSIDRSTFVRELNKVREIRNDVMHFDPDGITDGDLEALRRFVAFLQKLRDIGAS